MTDLPDDPAATPSEDVRRVVLAPRGGAVSVERGVPPVLGRGEVLIRTAYSVVSAGTERSKLELAGKGLIGKARARPDMPKLVLDKMKVEGPAATLKAVRRRLDESMALGYSNAGEVLAVGPAVEGISVGDRVAAGGGRALHADVVAVPRNLVARVPEGVPLDSAAFATIGSVALHAVRLSGAALGETVVVVGLGLVGLLAGAVASAAGCRVVGIDLRPEAADRASRLGPFEAAVSAQADAAEAVRRLTNGLGADAVILCAAATDDGPMRLAAHLARDRARVVVVGDLPVHAPRDLYYEKELEVVVSRSYGPGRYDAGYEEGGHDYPAGYVRWTEGRNLEGFLGLIAAGRLDVAPLVTHRVPVERAPEAYEALASTAGAVVLLDFGERPVRATPRPAARPRSAAGGAPRVGLIGTGSFAERILIPAIQAAGGDLVGVVSSQGRPSGLAAAARLEASAEALIASAPDAVFVATRHDTHAALARAALQAGIPVFVEKPLALSHGELDGVTEAWEAAGVPAMAGFNRRYAASARAVRDGLAGRSGPAMVSVRVNAGPLEAGHWLLDPQVGGGRILGEACHFVDLAAFLLGAAPREVFASAAGDGGPLGSQDAVITLRFADGSVGTVVYASGGDPATGKERVEAFAGGTSWVIDDWKASTRSTAGRRETLKADGDKGHHAEVAAFLAAVRGGGLLEQEFRSAIESTRATLAAIESLSLGLPVEV
jgi:predicted dehydrogenase/threonine dehydrogenase-like Zn-dependent dehydrogenase